MTRGAWAVARLLRGVPATTINLDELEDDWRELAAALVDAPDRGALGPRPPTRTAPARAQQACSGVNGWP